MLVKANRAGRPAQRLQCRVTMDYLRKYRKAQGINQVDMAKKVGIKFPTYRTMEQVGLGSFDNIKKVIRYTSTLLKKKGRRNER